MTAPMTAPEEGRYWRIPVTVTRTFYIDYWSDTATSKPEAAREAAEQPDLYELFPSPTGSSRDDVDADWMVADPDDIGWWPGDPNPTYLCPVCRRDVKACRVPVDDEWRTQIERHRAGGGDAYCAGGGQPAGEPRCPPCSR